MTSNIEVVDFKAEHLNYIVANSMFDTRLRPYVLPHHGEVIEKAGGMVTGLENGVPVFVGGVKKYWEGRGEAWIIFGKPSTQNFTAFFKLAQRMLEFSLIEFKRIEMVVDYDFVQGHRWARLLGFKLEAERMIGYQPHGGDASLYSVVRK